MVRDAADVNREREGVKRLQLVPPTSWLSAVRQELLLVEPILTSIRWSHSPALGHTRWNKSPRLSGPAVHSVLVQLSGAPPTAVIEIGAPVGLGESEAVAAVGSDGLKVGEFEVTVILKVVLVSVADADLVCEMVSGSGVKLSVKLSVISNVTEKDSVNVMASVIVNAGQND